MGKNKGKGESESIRPDDETEDLRQVSPSQIFLEKYESMASVVFSDEAVDLGALPTVVGKDLPLTPPDPTGPSDQRFWDKYEVIEQIGQGGMGTVYLVNDRTLQRKVAMKVLAVSERTVERIKRFLIEAIVTGKLGHPNIPPVYEVGEWPDTGELYYTMRYIKGETLFEIINRAKAGEKPSFLRRAQLILDVCRALEFAHSHGVINRDIKPANIIIEGGTGIVLDWGLAKVTTSDEDPLAESDDLFSPGELAHGLTRVGDVMGTLIYMSPEQARGEIDRLGPPSDIYSLGIVLYELLCLKSPFVFSPELEAMACLEIVATTEPLLPRTVDSKIPLELEEICTRAIKKQIGERYSSIAEMIADLQAYIEGEEKAEEKARKIRQALRKAQPRIKVYHLIAARVEETLEELDVVLESDTASERMPEIRERIENLEEQGEEAFLVALEASLAALSLKPRPEESAPALGEFFKRRLIKAEQEKDRLNMITFRRYLEDVNDGRFTQFLKSEADLVVRSQPAGASVCLFRFEEKDKRLVPVRQRELGSTPTTKITLASGSYLLILEKPGQRPVRCPVLVEREDQEILVNLYPDSQIGEGFIFVPAGLAIIGGDIPQAPGSKRRKKIHLNDFFITRDPITCREYAEFLSAVAGQKLARAKKIGPRESSAAETYWAWNDKERKFIVPKEDEQKPITGICWDDAMAYALWRSRKDGRDYSLPTEDEWEKAARGVDGRWYPWGDRFNGSFLNCRHGGGILLSVGNSPAEDISPYGVREVAGNAREYTFTEYSEDRRHRMVRSATITSAGGDLRLASRRVLIPETVMGWETFRLVFYPS